MDSLERLERDHPQIAHVWHRTLAAELGQRTARLDIANRALQR